MCFVLSLLLCTSSRRSSSLERLLETAKIMAHHLPDDLNLREKMLDACRNLMLSTTNMLNTALPENDMVRQGRTASLFL